MAPSSYKAKQMIVMRRDQLNVLPYLTAAVTHLLFKRPAL